MSWLRLILANVIPVYKKDDKRLPSNYGPISLTSVFVNIMECIIRSQLVECLERSDCICDDQYGFRKSRSTVFLLLGAVNDWCLCLE